MARFKIEATWDEDPDGAPVVQVEYARLEQIDDTAFAQMVSVGHMRPDDEPVVWDVLGDELVTDLPLLSPKRVRRHALDWLAEHAQMVGADSFELVIWQRAGRDALEQIEAAIA
jgi:hypothetical protein